MFLRILACAISLGFLTTAAFAENKHLPLDQKLLSAKTTDIDYNYTLHSQFLKSKVLQTADMLANAGLFTICGEIRDHKGRKFIKLHAPKPNEQIILKQAHKLKRMGTALKRTNDDDYRLAGQLLFDLGGDIAQQKVDTAKSEVLVIEEFYREDLGTPKEQTAKDSEQLKGMADQVTGSFTSIFGQLSDTVQKDAFDKLNLTDILGGLTNAF